MIEGDLAQSDDHLHVLQQPEFLTKEGPTSSDFLRRRFVVRRCAADRGADVGIRQREAVGLMLRERLVREPEAMQCLVQPVPAAISGKDPPGSVPSVGSRSQSQHVQSSLRVAKSRDRSTPIGPLTELSSLCPGDRLPIVDQSRACCTGRDPIVQHRERAHSVGSVSGDHHPPPGAAKV